MAAKGLRFPSCAQRHALAGVALLMVGSLAKGGSPEPTLSDLHAAHQVMNRLTFGPRPGLLREVGENGWQDWFRHQLNPDTIADDACETLLRDRHLLSFRSLTELAKLGEDARDGARDELERRAKHDLQELVLLRAVHSRRQFLEVIVEFWRNHFNIDANKAPLLASDFEHQVLRRHTFGRFEDLLLATAQHPAMLIYLDNHISTRRGLNENYARELMELHTLGVDNGYTQADVVSLAQTLTGWSFGWTKDARGERAYGFVFRAGDHDTRPAKWLDLRFDGRDGLADGKRAIRRLARDPATAEFLAQKLCRYLVNDAPPTELVVRVANEFLTSGGDLQRVYSAIVLSPEFFQRRNYRVKFKTPFEFTVSSLRATDAQVETAEPILAYLESMGQPIDECLEPTGYSDLREAWLDPGVMIYRWDFAIALVTGKIQGVRAGDQFVNELRERPRSGKDSGMMKLLLPGIADKKTESLLLAIPDLRLQAAFALGSPAFQLQ
jgi:uncharacterized protein (DUF1800 family)